MAISYLAVDGSSAPAVEESALADPGSLAQSSTIAININKSWLTGSLSLVGEVS